MMASINPLGERARGNRWWRTAATFTAGCLLGGWALGAGTGILGRLLAEMTGRAGAGGSALVAAALLLGAGVAELADWPVPSRRRQVDEAWIGRYRGWVYGAGFGVQLGLGMATTVTTASIYATAGICVVLGAGGQAGWAQAAGAVFGLARACPVLAAVAVREPESLHRLAARMASATGPGRLATGSSLCALAVWAAVSGQVALLSGHGLAVALPRGWDGAIFRRGEVDALPVLHAASMPLPPDRADSGGGVVERLGWGDVFLCLLEHDESCAKTTLFASDGPPLALSQDWFAPQALQGMRPAQSAAQRFFSARERAFSLLVVVGEHARRHRLLPAVEKVLATLTIEPADQRT